MFRHLGNKKPVNKLINKLVNKFIVGAAFGLAMVVPTMALAAYIPPKDEVPPKKTSRSTSAGIRTGCESLITGQAPSMIGLAPFSYMGKTSSSHPTFAWFASDDFVSPAVFSLYEYDREKHNIKAQPIFQKRLVSSSGMMAFSLPEESPGLVDGNTYVWQVVLECSTQNPSKNPWLRRALAVDMPSSELQQQLANQTDSVQKLDLYAENGYWYDALALAVGDRTSVQVKQAMVGLIDDLAKLEYDREPSYQLPESRLSYHLKQIVVGEEQRSIQLSEIVN